MNKIKRYRLLFCLIIIFFFVSCVKNYVYIPAKDTTGIFGTNLIIEGVGAMGIKLGDTIDKVKNILGEPENVWTNKFISLGEFILDISFLFPLDDINTGIITYMDAMFSLKVYMPDKLVLDQPFFKYAYIYYNNGIIIYLDDNNRVVELLLLTYQKKLSYTYRDLEIEFKPFIGYLFFSDVLTISNDYEFNLTNTIYYYSIQNHPINDVIYYYNSLTEELVALSIISPLIGGTAAYFGFHDHYEDVLGTQQQWRRKYGNQYIRSKWWEEFKWEIE